MEWKIIYYSTKVQQDILRFPPSIQARYFNLTDRMQKFGPNLGMPPREHWAASVGQSVQVV